MRRTVVLDSGAYSCKAAFAGDESPRIVPNCAVRAKRGQHLFVADQLDSLVDYSNMLYRRPCEKGFIVNRELQSEIWGRIFGKTVLDVDPLECSLLLTEAPLCPSAIQRLTDELVFEKFGFHSCFRACAASLCHDNDATAASLVVDSGFSFTHAVPVFKSTAINYGIRRVDVGGKLLTNFLKESISYRAWNMMDETHLVNSIKEKLCYVALDFQKTLAQTKSLKGSESIRRRFVLPSGDRAGYVLEEAEKQRGDDAQILVMNNERIAVPELLFNPADIGIHQAGVAELIVQSIDACPEELHRSLYSNIRLVGGNANLANFRERIEQDVRRMAPSQVDIRTSCEQQPELSVWRAAARFASSNEFESFCVTRRQYEEFGSTAIQSRFNIF